MGWVVGCGYKEERGLDVLRECFNVFKRRKRQSYQLRMGRYEIGGFTREDNVSHLRKWGRELTLRQCGEFIRNFETAHLKQNQSPDQWHRVQLTQRCW